MTKRTLKKMLLKYKLERDVDNLYKGGWRKADHFWCADKGEVKGSS